MEHIKNTDSLYWQLTAKVQNILDIHIVKLYASNDLCLSMIRFLVQLIHIQEKIHLLDWKFLLQLFDHDHFYTPDVCFILFVFCWNYWWYIYKFVLIWNCLCNKMRKSLIWMINLLLPFINGFVFKKGLLFYLVRLPYFRSVVALDNATNYSGIQQRIYLEPFLLCSFFKTSWPWS